jgi:hypothetical protein
MKFCLLFTMSVMIQLLCTGQKLKTGTYIFGYCDLEYNSCPGTCKVVIKGDSIIIYATKELARRITHISEGDTLDQGIILKHQSGKWIVSKTRKDIYAKEIGVEGPAILDFKKRQYWTF